MTGDLELTARCDRCLQLIEDGAGVLEVNAAAAQRVLEQWWRKSLGPGVFDGRRIRWVTRHRRCGRAPAGAYSIPVERVRSWTALLEWGVHLTDKPFFAATDWPMLVRRALDPHQAAVSGILPRVPRPLRRGPVGSTDGG
ncbi:hypothetical protein [Streptomyces sp. NPDC056056]|uniref:hypothetical protein n=1 Tax=Streptomyces sp. NPDC056056 TaxID=3345698 RepID=UPI0035E1C1A3